MHSLGFRTRFSYKKKSGEIEHFENNHDISLCGKIKVGNKEIPMKSFVGNFIRLLYLMIADSSEVSGIKNTANNSLIYLTTTSGMIGNSQDYGLFVGSGSTAIAQDDYNVETKINEGSATGELNYNTTGVGNTTTLSDRHQVTISRNITNNSGAAITIEEAAMILDASTNPTSQFLLARDLLGGISIANGETRPITYLIESIFSTAKGLHANFMKLIESILSSRSPSCVQTSGSTSSSSWSNPTAFSISAAQNVDRFGIRVGTSNAAFSSSDYTLGSLVEDGNGDDEILYGTGIKTNGFYATPFETGNEIAFRVGREFVYNGSSTLTLKEYDLVCLNSGKHLQLLRGLITPEKTLNPGDRFTVTLEFFTQV